MHGRRFRSLKFESELLNRARSWARSARVDTKERPRFSRSKPPGRRFELKVCGSPSAKVVHFQRFKISKFFSIVSNFLYQNFANLFLPNVQIKIHQKFSEKMQNYSLTKKCWRFLTEILRLESGAKECIV